LLTHQITKVSQTFVISSLYQRKIRASPFDNYATSRVWCKLRYLQGVEGDISRIITPLDAGISFNQKLLTTPLTKTVKKA
jgi:hypothetical protein